MTAQEMEQVATMVAEKIKEGKFEEDTGTAILILHSIAHSKGSPGIMVDPDVVARTPVSATTMCASAYVKGITKARN